MKIRQLSGLVMFSALSVPQAAMACDACWGTVGVKVWKTTFSPGGGMATSTATVPMPTITLGYDKVFGNVSITKPTDYTNSSYPFTTDNHRQTSVNLGYLITPEIFLALGNKSETEEYNKNSTSNMMSTTADTTMIGSSYNHTFTDSPFSINGTISYGKGSIQVRAGDPNYTYAGTLSSSSAYLSYEVGAGYSLTRNIKFNLGYRVEQYDQLIPTSVISAVFGIPPTPGTITFAKQKVKVSGLIAGFVFAF